MPQPDQPPSRRRDAYADYSYRRKLGLAELLPAIGVAIGTGLVAFYITRLLLQRTPLKVDRGGARRTPAGVGKTERITRSGTDIRA